MKRRVGIGIGCMLAAMALAGCETGRKLLTRPAAEADRPMAYDLDAIRDGSKLEIPDDDPSSVLKPSRGAGTWSPEAREIEKSLGVGP